MHSVHINELEHILQLLGHDSQALFKIKYPESHDEQLVLFVHFRQ